MDQNQNRENRRREIEFSFGPLNAKIRGYDILLTLIVAALAAFFVYFYQSDKTIAAEHHVIMEKTEEAQASLREISYILTLDEKDRKNLKLEMPESLRKRQQR